jgi:phosphoribosylanthranilate isomerase
MLIKICGITSEPDALLAAALGADAVGFIFAPSTRQVSPQAVRRIIERMPPEILTVGVFRNEARVRVVEIVNSIGLRAAQLHGDETVEDTRWVAERVPLVIKAFPAGHRNVGRFNEYGAGAVLVDAESPGSGEVFDWRLAEGIADPERLIVSGGLHADNVADAINHLHPFGVDVASGVESSPGVKDPRRLRAFVVAARQAAGESPEQSGRSGIWPGAPGVADVHGADKEDDLEAPFDWQDDL